MRRFEEVQAARDEWVKLCESHRMASGSQFRSAYAPHSIRAVCSVPKSAVSPLFPSVSTSLRASATSAVKSFVQKELTAEVAECAEKFLWNRRVIEQRF